MKPYLVDVPVRINIWIRPECQRKQWDVIKQARPSVLFIQSDGGRNEKEWKAILQNRKMIEDELDWDCKVYKCYQSENKGLYGISPIMRKLIWSNADRCILLEDDQVPAVSYFKFCAELLEKYKDDQRIECICGVNQLEKCENVTSSYFFSRQGSIWGIATWKRVIDERYNYAYGSDPYIMDVLKERTKHNPIAWKRLNAYAKGNQYEGHVAGSEFWIEFDMYAQNRLQIIPKYNMISNIGASEDSAHADSLKLLPRGIRKVFNLPVHELGGSIIHPKYVMPDVEYEKKRNRVMGYNTSIIQFARKIERFVLMASHGNLKRALSKVFVKKKEK